MARIQLEPKQERIVRTLEGPLFVSAGAGSGKTFTLTQRIMHALRPGSKPRELWHDPNRPEPFLESIDQVLAITFTEKAAAELKQRIRSALIDESMEVEAEKVDDAWISTIHGMCSRIIRAHALDVGVDPAFTVVGYADDLKRLAVEHVVRRVAADDAQGTGTFSEILDAFALEGAGGPSQGLDSLFSILVAILARVSATVGGLSAFREIDPAPSPRSILEAYRAIAETPSYANASAARVALDAINAYLASPRTCDDLRACYEAAGELSLRGKGMGKDEKTAVEEVRAARPAFFADAYLAARASALDELMPLVEQVRDEYDALKADQAILDNDDLLTRAFDALNNDERIRREFSGRFKMVMVDEFQDTAQQQVELVRLLCSPDGRELCTVGDAQQSIYRFRGADVSVFRGKKEEVERDGVVCDLDVNYRSHADILSFADRIFEGGKDNPLGRDFLHLVSCGEGKRKGARQVSAETSRRQAVLAVGGTSDDRAAVKAAAIAERFTHLRDAEGIKPSEMVILMARLSKADVYADAIRRAGMPCVVSGGTSVYRRAPEVGVISALLAFLANSDDGERGITPLITSPMFCLGATELLALSTCVDAETGAIDSRTITGDVLLSAEILDDFGSLPLVERMRDVLGRAQERVGRDPMSAIVRDAVSESGWLARLEQGGAQERAVAANLLKAIAIVEEEEVGRAFSPRLVADAFASHIANMKESPATLSGEDEDAVRIMTVHASKGLEFPVVAVAECDGIQANKDRIQMLDRDGVTAWVALPNRFELATDESLLKDAMGSLNELEKQAADAGERQNVIPASAAQAFAYMRRENIGLDYEEAARLLYVAITRAREVAILALGARYASELEPGHATSLVGEVLSRILPRHEDLAGLPDLGSDRLAFPDAHPGDFQMVLLDDLVYPAKKKGVKRPQVEFSAADYLPPAVLDEQDAATDEASCADRTVLLAEPKLVEISMVPASARPRDSYSYSSIAAMSHAELEDRNAPAAPSDDDVLTNEEVMRANPDAAGVARGNRGASAAPSYGGAVSTSGDGDPTALGSAFHAAAQWLIETGAETVPATRIDALCRFWGVTAAQRSRLEAALVRWERSDVRALMRSWPQVRAEVPFFSLGLDEFRESFGMYAEGAIDVLCTDPARPAEALVLDYKTGGSPAETPECLQEKHALQARVYADVLHKAGYDRVSLVFVRVEVDDPGRPGEPQTVTYHL